MESSEKTAWLSILTNTLLVGIKIARRPARRFPYGLYKVENLVALLSSILILFAGYEILKAVFFGERWPLPENIPLSIIGLCSTRIITWIFSHYELKKGQGHQSGPMAPGKGGNCTDSPQDQGGVFGNSGAEILLTQETDADSALEQRVANKGAPQRVRGLPCFQEGESG